MQHDVFVSFLELLVQEFNDIPVFGDEKPMQQFPVKRLSAAHIFSVFCALAKVAEEGSTHLNLGQIEDTKTTRFGIMVYCGFLMFCAPFWNCTRLFGVLKRQGLAGFDSIDQ